MDDKRSVFIASVNFVGDIFSIFILEFSCFFFRF